MFKGREMTDYLADILTAIGPFLQCRSDTFLIRTYGESLNPVTDEVESRAWCEATVQRIPNRVDGGDIIAEATADVVVGGPADESVVAFETHERHRAGGEL